MWALRRSVSAKATTSEPSLPATPKSVRRIRRLMIRAPSNWARGVEGKACHRQSAAAGLRLIDGGCEIALEGSLRQQPGARIDQTVGIERAQRAAKMRLKRVLAD